MIVIFAINGLKRKLSKDMIKLVMVFLLLTVNTFSKLFCPESCQTSKMELFGKIANG